MNDKNFFRNTFLSAGVGIKLAVAIVSILSTVTALSFSVGKFAGRVELRLQYTEQQIDGLQKDIRDLQARIK